MSEQSGQVRDLQVAIVGAGFGGIAAAVALRRYGIEDFEILERADGIGGTWLHNSYPGCACDVPSHLYSFSFAQRRDWPRLCPVQGEIHEYILDVVRRFDLERSVRTGVEVRSARWDEDAGSWMLDTSSGPVRARAVVFATGQLDKPAVPRIPGSESFEGHSFHSARWDHGYELRGRRVGVVGTGASAVQFVPEIAPSVARLTVFQRTGNWFMPRRNRPYPTALRWVFSASPLIQRMRRAFVFNYTEGLTATIRHPRTLGRIAAWRSAAFMRMQVRDPQLRAKIWPDYTFGCKRVLFSSLFLPALQRPNVELTTSAIERIEPEGIRTADGVLHELDCIIWGTGFKTHEFMAPVEVHGRDGIGLRDAWRGSPHAYLGMTVPGFPNMFLMYGPNTNTSGGSILVYLEAQASYIAQAVAMLRGGARSLDVRADVEDAADRALQERFRGTAWEACDSWYRLECGRIVTNWPGYMRDYVAATATLDPADFELEPARQPALTATGGSDV